MRIKGFAAAIGWLAASQSLTVQAAQTAQTAQALRQRVAGQLAGRDLAANPPEIASMHLFPIAADAEGNARLEAYFREDLPDAVTVLLDGKPVLLRDDGLGEDNRAWDGIYCARVKATAAELKSAGAAQVAPADMVSLSARDRGGVALAMPASPGALSESPSASMAAAAAAVNPAYLVDPEKALLIRNTNVLNHYFRTTDPCKNVATPSGANPPPPDSARKWSFGYLMTQMANSAATKVSTSAFALAWLDEWAKTQTINGDLLQEVDGGGQGYTVAKVVKAQWLAASGNNGKLKMGKAPFRLLAIVNRIDKRDNLAFGGGTAGELRFVFGLLDLTHKEPGGQCASMGMTKPADLHDGEGGSETTVILEFAVDKATQADVKAWGQKWIDLSKKTQDSPDYRTFLEGITESVVKAGAGTAKARANGSALMVMRVNEGNDDNIWDLREFSINATSHTFKAQTVANTPAAKINGNPNQGANPFSKPPTPGPDQSGDLYIWGHANATAIKAEKHVIPLKFPTNTGYTYANTYFRGSHALTHLPPWTLGYENGDTEMRFRLSFNTCNGCHSSEGVGMKHLVFHVFGRPFKQRAELSNFLTGMGDNVFSATPYPSTDYVSGGVHYFAELERRRQDLAVLMGSTTLSSLSFQPLTQTH